MKVKSVFAVLLIGLFLFCVPLVWADSQVYTLGEIVVSEENQAVEDITQVTVITAEDVKATSSHTVADVLRYAPGLSVTTGRKAETDVSIHGFDQGKILVLIDGIPYYETYYGKLDLSQIPADIISKIVITKGAASVLYGANAEAGVINIVTKKAGEKLSASVNMELGENNTYRGSAFLSQKRGIFNYSLNVVREESDGWNMSDDFDPVVGSYGKGAGKVSAVLEDGGTRNNSDSKNTDFWARFGVEPNPDSEYYVSLRVAEGEKGFPLNIYENPKHFTSRPAFSYLARSKYKDAGIDLSGRQVINDQLTLKAKVFYHEHEDDYISYTDTTYDSQMGVSTFKDQCAGVSLFSDYKPVDWDTLKFSLHYKLDSHKSRDDEYLPFQEAKANTGSVGIENEFKAGPNLSVVAGVSYDWFDVIKAQENNTLKATGALISQDDLAEPGVKDSLNPMIGVVYNLKDTTKLFASVAHKTRFPTLNQLYSSKSGNTELNEEKTINYTVGASRPFFDMVNMEVAFFYHDISDRISRPSTTSNYENYDKIAVSGVELASEAYLTDDLTVRAGYTYIHARDKSDNRVTDNVTGIPESKIDLGVEYIVPSVKTKLNVTSIYMARTYSQLPTASKPADDELESDDYWVFNARITQPITEHLEIYASVNNLFDDDYEQEWGWPGHGREVWAGLTAKF